jgi:hypothetical protein
MTLSSAALFQDAEGRGAYSAVRPSGHPEADFVVSDRYLRSLYSAACQVLGGIVITSPGGPVGELGAGRGLARRLGYLWMQSDLGDEDAPALRCDVRRRTIADGSLGAGRGSPQHWSS